MLAYMSIGNNTAQRSACAETHIQIAQKGTRTSGRGRLRLARRTSTAVTASMSPPEAAAADA
jgi:hypothetical protein